MRNLIATTVICTLLISCKKSPHISSKEISSLASIPVTKILSQKKYQLDENPSLEDISLFEGDKKTHIAFFTPTEKGYTLLRKYTFDQEIIDPKIHFVSIGNKKSQLLLTYGSKEKSIFLLDTKDFIQEFSSKMVDIATVKIIKSEEKPFDELLVFGDKNYRFNGIRWIPFNADEIFPFLETFNVQGEDSLIEIVNRGQFGTRVIVTLAFAGITGDIGKKIRLTKDIPTVRLYKPGYPAHKKGGGNQALNYPLVEIQKDSWGKNGRIKLPLFMDGIEHFSIRAVYSQRGHTLEWPSIAAAGIIKDGQGYLAVTK
ncbi:MAG: hypothetical protein LDLANPLL_01065 [Turneriella sp.]|nr:hypothetical protein [Turneriella sp.]